MNEILLYFSLKYKGEWKEIYQAILKKEMIDENDFNLRMQDFKKHQIEYITILDDLYPKQLMHTTQPPFVLYYKGNISILNKTNKCIYLTGAYETQSINNYVSKLKSKKENVTFLNLIWPGLEQSILNTLFRNNFKTIILLPCGIDWAIKNLNLGKFENPNCLFLSEFPNDIHPTKNSFISRNRISAGLCSSLVLLSSIDQRYNSLINEFLDQGKNIQCLLFNDHDKKDGNVDLINQGAELITETSEIF
ncbi:DNA processing protein (Smf) [Metamycoplasma auris 15026]|uniref:DNA processing protein (Smf) n=1 Tax=Metamycoplasma auris 15026 TaxID=1188233 RepID=N9VD40_9BACT|nr:DNA-processing protein DprA [Metamycoplasma auris]ENY69326.1 DNA processing protein (Smf) [Metamycoplasma auris 15026]